MWSPHWMRFGKAVSSTRTLCSGPALSCRYHMECLDPPLQEVPVDEWFCPECAAPGVVLAAGEDAAPISRRAWAFSLSALRPRG